MRIQSFLKNERVKKFIPLIIFALFIIILYMVGYDLDTSVQPPVENRRYDWIGHFEKFKNFNIHSLIRLILLAGTLYTIYLAIRIIEDFIKKMIEIIRNRNF